MKILQLLEQKEKLISEIGWVAKILDDNGNMPESYDYLNLSGYKITSLKGVSKHVKTYCDVASNELTDLEYVPEYIGTYLQINKNKISSLANIHTKIKHVKRIECIGNPIKSNVLGLLKISGLENVYMFDEGKHIYGISYPEINEKLKTVEEIVNRHLPNGDILECQVELLDAGLSEYAKL